MSTCCPEFRADLLAARAAVRRITLQAFEGYATQSEMDAASERLHGLEGSPDLLAKPDYSLRYEFETRVCLRRMARRSQARRANVGC
jgi:hypothetical protein